MRTAIAAVLAIAWLAVASTTAGPQESQPQAVRRNPFDQILDTYVRDGYVYYRALKGDRSKLDGYLTQLAKAQLDQLPREDRIAFWLNAYNALVLQTVVDHYPIQGRSSAYPSRSIRQIPGAFERLTHLVAGRTMTLDQIEQTVLPEFHDPRLYFALGRGSVGGGRLRSEAFAPALLETQLSGVASECATRSQCVQVDRATDKLLVSPIFSWREKDFVAAYGDRPPIAFASRAPIERAVLSFVGPRLVTIELEALEKNTFQMVYQPYDWTLNDLTGRGGR
jgi:hypothetical protein